MKKRLFYLAFTIAILAITTAFVSNDNPVTKTEVTEAPIDYMTMSNLGLNLDVSGELMVMDNKLFRAEVEKMISDAGIDLQVKNIISKKSVTNGEVISKTFAIQYLDDSDEHTVTISYNKIAVNNSKAAPIKAVPLCINIGCTSGCNPGISTTGANTCSACKGPWYSSCSLIYVPEL